MAHVRQSWPVSGLGFQVKVPKAWELVPSGAGVFDGQDRPRVQNFVSFGIWI